MHVAYKFIKFREFSYYTSMNFFFKYYVKNIDVCDVRPKKTLTGRFEPNVKWGFTVFWITSFCIILSHLQLNLNLLKYQVIVYLLSSRNF